MQNSNVTWNSTAEDILHYRWFGGAVMLGLTP